LFFFCLVESIDAENVARAASTGKPFASLFSGEWPLNNPLNAPTHEVRDGGMPIHRLSTAQHSIPRSRLRWSDWARNLGGEALVRFVRDEVFPFYAGMGEASVREFMRGARLGIEEPTVLTQVVALVDSLGLGQADADTKGDLFEHVLRQIKQAGELGQFRTPRHIIRTIVEMVDPQVGETVYDPAAGTAGFLVAAYNHIRLAKSSPAAVLQIDLDGKTHRRGHGDLLSPAELQQLKQGSFFGNDVDPKMVRLALMNLTLRGLSDVPILLRNVLTSAFEADRKAAMGVPAEGFDVVLANPPFAGRVDKDRIVGHLKVGSTSATELLFLNYILDCLRAGGRAAVIVPEGVLFGSTSAHRHLRRNLIEDHGVDAVLSMPSGVFQPYSGVKTSALFFRKGGQTRHVLFLQAEHDGYQLDANHDTPIEADDLPALAHTYRRRDAAWTEWEARDTEAAWPHPWWFAEAAVIEANQYDLSAARYRPTHQAEVEHHDSARLLEELAAIEAEIAERIKALREALAKGFD
ncbi:MAG: type I restriction-modification system subunit M, partial [Gammaproteobacteria bacterium]|nr:type I restriction-modification system subunit M [Gammaproteobacteria bacterium]